MITDFYDHPILRPVYHELDFYRPKSMLHNIFQNIAENPFATRFTQM